MSQTKNKIAVVALGGNAVSPKGERDTIPNQFRHTRESLVAVRHLIKSGYNLVITHGNGPQVGNALLRTELTAEQTPILPLGICVADIQGGMGYMIQQSLQNLLRQENIHREVVTVITQVVVNRDDPEVKNPTKFIGQYYDESKVKQLMERFGWKIHQTSSGEWRRVVPSPIPKSIVESTAIKDLLNGGKIVIAAGGGGIPVYLLENENLEGLDAVVDKDLASAVLGCEIGAQELFILTDVEGVALNYGKPNESCIRKLNVNEAKRLYKEGHFPPGSMGPKITAAINFLESGGECVIITSIEAIKKTLAGKGGTTITK